ncbi:MAG: ribosome maturation factor RimP [Deltaproteobacteria bacterium]|nr:ribosome maturation factor RimP [Deltaproteobacteria bacterium]
MSRNPLHTRLISVVEPVCNAAGFDLVELRFVLEQTGWVLRVCVDLPLDASVAVRDVPTDRVDLSDCEDLSRELSAVLDVNDPIPQAYSLEVSSPGIDRPLRTAGHFTHFTGSDVKIQLAVPLALPGGERRNFRGILGGVVGEHNDLVAITCDGQRFELPIDDIDHARLVPDWDAVMKGGSGFGGPQQDGPRKKGQKPPKPRIHHASPAPDSDADKTNT